MARKKRSETSEARRFAIILVLLLAALAAFSLWRGHPVRAGIVTSVAVAALICAVAFFPVWLKFFGLWMKLAEVLSRVMTRVLLAVVFYLVLTPIALLMRVLGKVPLDLAWQDLKPTYWIDKPAGEYTVERYSKQF